MQPTPQTPVAPSLLGAPLDLVALLHPSHENASRESQLLWLCARVSASANDLMEIARLGSELKDSDWEQLMERARLNGVENLIFTRVAEASILPSAPPDLARRMRQRYAQVTIATRRLECVLERLLPRFQAARAPVVVLKGMALARRLYPELALRPISDIDLLVRPEDLTRWEPALRAEGFEPEMSKSEPLSKHVLRFREMQFRDARGQMIEAHVALCRYPAYRQAFAPRALWGAARPLPGAAGGALALAPDDELAFLCLHYAVQHRIGRLIWLTDVAEIARRIPDAQAWDALAEQVAIRGVAAPVAVTLAHARALLDAPVPDATLERLRSAALEPAERHAWASATRSMSGLRWYLSQLSVVRTAGERATLLLNGGAALAGRVRRRARHKRRSLDDTT
jgi:hypothetical protein